MRLPSPIVRLLIGEMADELVLSSSRAIPEKLTQAGFQFAHPQIKEALNHLLKVE